MSAIAYRKQEELTSSVAYPETSINDLLLGQISFSQQLESPPTLTIRFTNLVKDRKKQVLAKYKKGYKVSFEGWDFIVDTVKETRSREQRTNIRFKGRRPFLLELVDITVNCIWIFNVEVNQTVSIPLSNRKNTVTIQEIAEKAGVHCSVNHTFKVNKDGKEKEYKSSLVGALSEVARLKNGFIYYFPRDIGIKKIQSAGGLISTTYQIIDYEKSSQQAIPYYKNAQLSWGRDPDETNAEKEFADENVQNKFILKEPVKETLVKESFRLLVPPFDTKVLKGLDSNAYKSGTKKDRITTTTIDGTTISQKIETYGFSYTSLDIYNPDYDNDYPLLSLNPQSYWTLVEKQTIDYIFTSAGVITYSLSAIDPKTNQRLKLIIDPDFERFISKDGDGVSFKPSSRYLIRVKKKNLKLRPIKEDKGIDFLQVHWDFLDGGYTQEHYDRFVEVYEPQWITIRGEQQYELRTLRPDLKRYLTEKEQKEKNEQSPFSVQWLDYDKLSPKIKLSIPTYESINSDRQVGVVTVDPNYEETYYVKREVDGKYGFVWRIDPSEEEEFPVPLTVGEESITEVIREIKGKNLYEETRLSATAQSAGFADIYETAEIELKSGLPPSASTLKSNWENQDNQQTPQQNNPTQKEYYISSSPYSKLGRSLDNASFPQCSSLEESLIAAKAQLQIESMNARQDSYTLAYYHPQFKIGDPFGRGLITAISIDLDIGQPQYPITCNGGTKITVGVLTNNLQIQYTEKNPESQTDRSNTPEVNISVASQTGLAIGNINFNIPNRRKF